MSDYVRNSLGSLQGGMTAFLADLAGQYVACEATGKSGQTRDLVIHYMSPGITGPFQTTAEVLRMDRHSALTRIRVVDQGNDHRLMAVVLNTVCQRMYERAKVFIGKNIGLVRMKEKISAHPFLM